MTPLEAARADEWHSTIPVGAIVRHASGKRVRITSRSGYRYGCQYVRKDGERDMRHDVGFTAFLRCDEWIWERGDVR